MVYGLRVPKRSLLAYPKVAAKFGERSVRSPEEALNRASRAGLEAGQSAHGSFGKGDKGCRTAGTWIIHTPGQNGDPAKEAWCEGCEDTKASFAVRNPP